MTRGKAIRNKLLQIAFIIFALSWNSCLGQIFDIEIVGSCTLMVADYPNFPASIAIEDDYAYVTAYFIGLEIIDISDPQVPRLDTVLHMGHHVYRHVFLSDHYAYVSSFFYTGLDIINVENPHTPYIVSNFPSLVGRYCYVKGNYAYHIREDNSFIWWLTILDVSDKFNPTQIGAVDLGADNPYKFCVNQNRAYMANGAFFFPIYDISDPYNPFLISRTAVDRAPEGIFENNNYIYATQRGDYNIRIFDSSDPLNPVVVDSCAQHTFQVYGRYPYIYVAKSCGYYICNLEVYSIEDRVHPVLVANYFESEGEISDICTDGNLIYITTWDQDHWMLKILRLTPTAVQNDGVGSVENYRFYNNYPNPFNSATEIQFSLPSPGPASLVIYDIQGREIRRLFDSDFDAGTHNVIWNGFNDDSQPVSSGIYFYKLNSGNATQTNRMTLLR